MNTYTGSRIDANFINFSGWSGTHRAFSAASPYRIDAQWVIKPLTDEVLNLIYLSLLGGTALAIRNETGGTLTAGTLLYVSGYNATEGKCLVAKADADSPATLAQLVLDEDLDTATNGVAYPYRDVLNLNTASASAVGAAVYLSATAGAFAFTAPTGADQEVQRVGAVTAKDATEGSIRFFPGAHLAEKFGTSALQNSSVTAAKVAKAENFAWSGAHTHSGTVGFSGAVTIWDKLSITDPISPSQLTGDQDDYNPSGLSSSTVVRITSDATRTITGLAGGTDGRLVFLSNVGANDIVLSAEDGSSSAANRFALSENITLAPDAVAMLQFDAGLARWLAVSGGAASGVSGFSGASGSVGPTGSSGYSGASGTSGTSGYTGISGFSGTAGVLGGDGDSGYSGISGISGTSGTSGYSGTEGPTGTVSTTPELLRPTSYEPPSSSYATLDTRNGHPVLDFDGTSDEEAVWTCRLSDGYGGGGLTVTVVCAFTSATSGSVRWQGAFERIDASSLDIDSDSFTSFQSAGGSAPGTSGQVIYVDIAFTDGAQIDSIAAGELYRFKLRRDADGTSGTDDIASDAEVLAVIVTET